MIPLLGFKFGSMVDILPHEAKWDVWYTNAKWAWVQS